MTNRDLTHDSDNHRVLLRGIAEVSRSSNAPAVERDLLADKEWRGGASGPINPDSPEARNLASLFDALASAGYIAAAGSSAEFPDRVWSLTDAGRAHVATMTD